MDELPEPIGTGLNQGTLPPCFDWEWMRSWEGGSGVAGGLGHGHVAASHLCDCVQRAGPGLSVAHAPYPLPWV
jgi:hypothetical protein